MPVIALPAPSLSPELVIKFWSHVDQRGRNECWPWVGGFYSRCRYGRFNVKRRGYRAHSIALFLHTGHWPLGFMTCHRCDNPECCNPTHLFAGTPADNHWDAMIKGRKHQPPPSHPGETHPNSKLTDDQVRLIRNLYESGQHSQQAIADRFGVLQTTVSGIVRRKAWAHVD